MEWEWEWEWGWGWGRGGEGKGRVGRVYVERRRIVVVGVMDVWVSGCLGVC